MSTLELPIGGKLLTGDDVVTAAAVASPLGQAILLHEYTTRGVRELRAKGHRLVMVGDGVNDAPALAQADISIAVANGTDVAMEAVHIVLMRGDGGLAADCIRIARRTRAVVKMKIAFTALHNLAGVSPAGFGTIPPILADSAQAIPEISILANSSRLIRPE